MINIKDLDQFYNMKVIGVDMGLVCTGPPLSYEEKRVYEGLELMTSTSQTKIESDIGEISKNPWILMLVVRFFLPSLRLQQ